MATRDADKQQVLFIQGGGGERGYEADAKLVSSLRAALGPAYTVRYPRMSVEDKPDFGWGAQIGKAIAATKSSTVVGHSLGASMLMKYITEHEVNHQIAGIFLISAPFWSAAHEALALQDGFADRLPNGVPIFLYHAIDDDEVGVAHVDMYAQQLPRATVRKIASGGHQLGNDLTPVAKDIGSLE